MNVVSRCSQWSESEQEPTYSLVTAVKSLKWAVTSLIAVLFVVILAEPKLLAVGSEFDLWPKNLWIAGHAPQSFGPMMAVSEPGQVLVPMDSHLLQVSPEPALVLTESMVAEFGLEIVVAAMY